MKKINLLISVCLLFIVACINTRNDNEIMILNVTTNDTIRVKPVHGFVMLDTIYTY